MSPRKIVLYSHSCNNVAAIRISDNHFLDSPKKIMIFGKKFELNNSVQFLDAKTDRIAEDLQPSKFLPASSISFCNLHIWIARFFFSVPLF